MSAATDRETGAVTAEFAVTLPAIVLLLVAVLTLAAASGAQLRVLDAARAGARAVAIGEPDDMVRQTIQRLAGAAADTELERSGEWVTVTVRKPLLVARVPFTASASATAWSEP